MSALIVCAPAGRAGATLRELMDRMGHMTDRAALIYLHGSGQRWAHRVRTGQKVTGARRELSGES